MLNHHDDPKFLSSSLAISRDVPVSGEAVTITLTGAAADSKVSWAELSDETSPTIVGVNIYK